MTVLWVVVAAGLILAVGGRIYSHYLAGKLGEDALRPTPAIRRRDGRDYVPTPTPVVFAHHFASIAGAGPILGPVIAIVYGWVPAVLWVVLGGLLIGAVHDYLATYMTTREGGQSIATIARRMLGKDAFIALTIFLVVILAMVCAAFLNTSVVALTSKLPFDRIDLPKEQTLFRVVDSQVVIGGIASMSVVCITAVAPLIGYLYLKRKVAVWKCSVLAIGICAASIVIGLYRPISIPPELWRYALSGYVLIAAGVPVWIFLQSRDFINVHILYVGMAALLLTLLVAGFRGGGSADPIPPINITEGTQALGFFWPSLFIVIACGAVSGFHSLCAGGTTCKQLTSESAARRVGYGSMLLESFLAVCVIGVMMIGAQRADYLQDVHPAVVGVSGKPNWVLGFAMAVGHAGRVAWNLPIAAGALAGMILLEGFLVTTLDTAIRLTRYLIEEIWRTLFDSYDVFAEPVAAGEAQADWPAGEATPIGAEGIPVAPLAADSPPAPAFPIATSGVFCWFLQLLRRYWVNSALAVGLMLGFAMTGGLTALWKIFATSNQLLAAMVLGLAALWLLRQQKAFWFALVPAVFMLVTTATNLVLMLLKFLSAPRENITLLTADVLILLITSYLLMAGLRELWRRPRSAQSLPSDGSSRKT